MSSLCLSAFIAVFLFAADTMPTVSRVSLDGNHFLARNQLALETEAGRPLSESLLARDRERIVVAYAAHGFLWTEVVVGPTPEAGRRPGVAQRVAVTFRITEGNRAKLAPVRLLGNHMIASTKLRTILPKRSGFYTEAGITADIHALLDFYSDNGYPFCEINPDSLRLAHDTVSCVLNIKEGGEVRLKDVAFSGHTETRPSVLKRMLGLKLNVAYSESETRRRVDRLGADPLLAIQGYDIRRTAGEYWLNLRVEEQKSNRVSGAVAYSALDNEFVGALNLNLDNLFGTRRAADLAWQRSPGRQDLSFAYTEPWMLGTAISLTAGASNSARDSSYSATELSLSGQTPIADFLTLRLGASYDLVAAVDSEPSSHTYWVTSGLGFDTRDHPVNPARGIYAELAARVGSRVLETLATGTIATANLDVSGIVPLAGRFALSVAGHGRNVYSPDTVYGYDLFELGGANSLRGYKEGQFVTPRCAWLNNELRYLSSPTSRIYPFFDIAVVQDATTGGDSLYSGYGAGMRVETAIGLIGLDYGIPTGVSPLKGKVHFSIQTSF